MASPPSNPAHRQNAALLRLAALVAEIVKNPRQSPEAAAPPLTPTKRKTAAVRR